MSALTFLGLARKAGRLEIGDESSGIAARAGKARVILTASDAGHTSQVRAENYSEAAKCPHVALPYTKEELGAALGRGTPGMIAVTDIGFACAFLEKLSAGHEEYAPAASLLREKRDRAEQRKKEAARHEKNVKRGRKR